MKVVTGSSEILRALCKSHKKWGMYASFRNERARTHDAPLAAPWLTKLGLDDSFDILSNGSVYLLFDTEDDMLEVYDQTYGDDGANTDYQGPYTVYALTCDPDGELQNENT